MYCDKDIKITNATKQAPITFLAFGSEYTAFCTGAFPYLALPISNYAETVLLQCCGFFMILFSFRSDEQVATLVSRRTRRRK